MAGGNTIKATFEADISPMEKAMSQLRAAVHATHQNVWKELKFEPTVNTGNLLAAGAQIQQQIAKWHQMAAKPIQLQVKEKSAADKYLDGAFARANQGGMQGGSGAGPAMDGGGGGFRNVGLLGQQAQDVIVQLQDGTNALTVFSQQGSQMASIFGPMGMIIGAGAAAIGVLGTVSVKGSNDLATLATSVKDFNDEVAKTAKGDDASAMLKQIDAVGKKRDEIMGNKSVDFWGRISGGLFGASQAETSNERENQLAQQERNRQTLAENLFRVEDERARLSQLMADGKDREAAAYRRSLEDARRIEEIEKSALYDNEKNAAIYAIRSASAAQERADARAAADEEKRKAEMAKQQDWQTYGAPRSAEAGRVQEATKALAESNFQAEMARAGEVEQAELLRLRATQLRAEAMADGPIQLSEELKLQQQINEMLAKANQLESEANAKKAQAVQTQQQAADAAQMEKDYAFWDDQLKGVKQDEAKAKLMNQAALTHMRAEGHGRMADKIEKQQVIDDQAKRIAADTGMPLDQAKQLAKQMDKDNQRAARAAGRIHGAHASQFEGLDGRKFNSLDAMVKRNQKRLGDDFQFPALDAMAKRKAADAAAANNQKPVISAPTLEQLTRELITTFKNQLTFAN